MERGFHPYQVLPNLSADDQARLEQSIRERGVEVPIVLDEHGQIIDGHHRAKIADSLGIGYPKTIKSGFSESEKRILAAELNIARRHLTDAQKVLLGQRIEPDIAERARERQIALAGTRRTSVTPVTEVDRPQRTTDEVANTVGIGSGRTYERGKQVLEELAKEPDAPQLLGHIESGDWQLNDARQELRERRNSRAKVRAELEQRQSAHLLGVVGDPHGDIARARLRSQFTNAKSETRRNLLSLDVEAVLSVTEADDVDGLRWFIRDTRTWLDQLEAGLKRGIRLVQSEGA